MAIFGEPDFAQENLRQAFYDIPDQSDLSIYNSYLSYQTPDALFYRANARQALANTAGYLRAIPETSTRWYENTNDQTANIYGVPIASADERFTNETDFLTSEYAKTGMPYIANETIEHAASRKQRFDAYQHRMFLIDRADQGLFTQAIGLGVSILASAIDPINLIPFGRAVSIPGRALLKAVGRGAIDGYAGNLVMESILNYQMSREFGTNFSIGEILFNSTVGAGFGALIGGGAFKYSNFHNKRLAQRAELNLDNRLAEINNLWSEENLVRTPQSLRPLPNIAPDDLARTSLSPRMYFGYDGAQVIRSQPWYSPDTPQATRTRFAQYTVDQVRQRQETADGLATSVRNRTFRETYDFPNITNAIDNRLTSRNIPLTNDEISSIGIARMGGDSLDLALHWYRNGMDDPNVISAIRKQNPALVDNALALQSISNYMLGNMAEGRLLPNDALDLVNRIQDPYMRDRATQLIATGEASNATDALTLLNQLNSEEIISAVRTLPGSENFNFNYGDGNPQSYMNQKMNEVLKKYRDGTREMGNEIFPYNVLDAADEILDSYNYMARAYDTVTQNLSSKAKVLWQRYLSSYEGGNVEPGVAFSMFERFDQNFYSVYNAFDTISDFTGIDTADAIAGSMEVRLNSRRQPVVELNGFMPDNMYVNEIAGMNLFEIASKNDLLGTSMDRFAKVLVAVADTNDNPALTIIAGDLRRRLQFNDLDTLYITDMDDLIDQYMAYARSNTALSTELGQFFDMFTNHLKRTYDDALSRGVGVTPEVRQFMDYDVAGMINYGDAFDNMVLKDAQGRYTQNIGPKDKAAFFQAADIAFDELGSQNFVTGPSRRILRRLEESIPETERFVYSSLPEYAVTQGDLIDSLGVLQAPYNTAVMRQIRLIEDELSQLGQYNSKTGEYSGDFSGASEATRDFLQMLRFAGEQRGLRAGQGPAEKWMRISQTVNRKMNDWVPEYMPQDVIERVRMIKDLEQDISNSENRFRMPEAYTPEQRELVFRSAETEIATLRETGELSQYAEIRLAEADAIYAQDQILTNEQSRLRIADYINCLAS